MAYFDTTFIRFFKELERNNNKEWFDKNRNIYEDSVKQPFKKFVEDLLLKIRDVDPEINMQAKDTIFRINRDIRFSKDKTPYNTKMKAGFSKGGRKSPYAGFYFGIGAKSFGVGGGVFMLEKDEIQKIRNEISSNPDEFLGIVNNKRFVSLFGRLKGEAVKRIPLEFQDTFQKTPYIANKQFYFMAEYEEVDKALKDDFMDFILDHCRVGYTLNEFLKRAM